MKGTTILLLGAATLVAYASAHPYTKIPDGLLQPDGYHYKKSSQNSNSNSYSQSNQDNADVDGAYGGQSFSGTKTSGYSTSGGSHSQSSSFASGSFNGQLPGQLAGGQSLLDAPQIPVTYSQSELPLGNPGTAGLGLSNAGSGSSSGTFSSSYGTSGLVDSGASDQSVNQESQTAEIGSNAVLGAAASDSNSGIFGPSGGSIGQTGLPVSGSIGTPGGVPFGQANSQPGGVQYWWNGPESPFGSSGKPSGGCNSNACTLSGSFDLGKGAAGAQASNQAGQVGLNINGGNPFLGKGQVGSGSVSSGATFGQPALGVGPALDRRPIDASGNPFLNGGYAGGSAAAAAGVGTYSSSSSFSGAGNPFLHPGSGSAQVPQGPASPGPDYKATQGSGFANAGSQNPFFKPGSGSVVVNPPIAKFPDQSNQGYPQFPSQSENSVPSVPQQPSAGNPFLKPGSGSSGSFGSAGSGDSQVQIGQVPSFPSQSSIDSGASSAEFPQIPEEGPSKVDDSLTVSCSGQGRICVLKNLCSNGKVVRNGQGLMQVRTGTQYCKVEHEVCCTLDGYSGAPTQIGVIHGVDFPTSGSAASSNSASTGNYGGSSANSGKPDHSGGFDQSQQSGGFDQSQVSGGFDQSQVSGGFDQSQVSGGFDQSQVSGGFDQSQVSGGFDQSKQTGGYDQSQQSTGSVGNYDQSQQGSFGGLGQPGKPVSSGGSFGQNAGKTGSDGSYEQTQQKESSNFGFQSSGQAYAGSKADSGSHVASGFKQGIPTGFPSGTPAPSLIHVTPAIAKRNPIGGYNGVNTGFGSANANADAQASSQAASSNIGSSIYTSPTYPTKGTHAGVAQPNPSKGGLFDSTDNSGEDLSAGEYGYKGSSGSVKGGSASNGYLPPIGSEPSSNVPAFSHPPREEQGETSDTVSTVKRPPPPAETFVPAPITIQVGCAAALICVEEQYCTLEGVISPQPVTLTKQQIERRAPLSTCRNPDSGIVGKCCRDPNYVDPWPTGNLPANYTGGFDEQGFPSYLNYAKTHPAKKPSPTKGGIRPPTKGRVPQNPFIKTSSQPTTYTGKQNIFPDFAALPDAISEGFSNFTSGIQSQLPNLPSFPNLPNLTQTFLENFGQRPSNPSQNPDTESSGNGPEVLSPSPNSDDHVQVTEKPVGSSTSSSFFGIPNIQLPNINLPNFPFPNPNTKNGYDSSASNQSPTIIAPHVPGTKCGLRNKVQRPSGLGDDDVAFGEIPWQAMILSTRDRKLLCSGAIVSTNAILTAAHCVVGLKAEEVSIKSGEWKLGYELKHEEPLPFEIVKVSQIIPHPGFYPDSPSHDFAILFLEHPIALDQHVDLICLGDIPQPKPGRNCIATGWGKTVLQVNVAGSLMHSIDVDIVPQDDCKERLQGAESQLEVDNTLTCVKPHKQRNNLCQVDVGGPLACDRGDGYYELTGVYSQDTGCLPTNQVATFALIDTNWVKQTLKSPPQVPNLNFENVLPSGESPASSNVKSNLHNHGQHPAPACDCQKSYLPPAINQYLPPV